MGKKLLCFIIAVCCALGLVACGGGKKIAMDSSSRVDNTLKAGFVAETADYVYFINGAESYATTYTTGDVTKGALMRVKKSEFADLSTANYETVVSKLIVADDTKAGFYIFGDYVYYAVPSTEKDTTGALKNDQLNFFSTKLDATGTSSNITGRDFPHSAQYRYIKSGDNVYLVVYSTELYVYDAKTCKEVYTTEAGKDDKKVDKIDVAEVLFSDSAVYFTTLPVNKDLSDEENVQKHAFHNVYKVNLGATVTGDLVIDGAGETFGGKAGLLGVTVDLLRAHNGKVYFSYTQINTGTGASSVYVAVEESKLASDKSATWMADNTPIAKNKHTANAYADTSIFHGDLVYYVDATFGLVCYDASKVGDAENTDLGLSVVKYSETLKTATLCFVSVEGEDTYMYFRDSSNNYYKVNLNGESDELRLNTFAVNATWYSPEVVKVGDAYYFVCSYSDSKFGSYVYAINTTKLAEEYEKLSDDDKADFYTERTEDDEEVLVRAEDFSSLLGQKSEADLKAEEESADA
ncbi:MAG: hypothetical protein IJW64_05445 [Clostridia bacterium]|nr:hypothetical protein [Clostridia bacterium]